MRHIGRVLAYSSSISETSYIPSELLYVDANQLMRSGVGVGRSPFTSSRTIANGFSLTAVLYQMSHLRVETPFTCGENRAPDRLELLKGEEHSGEQTIQTRATAVVRTVSVGLSVGIDEDPRPNPMPSVFGVVYLEALRLQPLRHSRIAVVLLDLRFLNAECLHVSVFRHQGIPPPSRNNVFPVCGAHLAFAIPPWLLSLGWRPLNFLMSVGIIANRWG